MIQLNLLPDLKKDYLNSLRTRNRIVSLMIIVMMASVGVVVVAVGYTYGFQKWQLSEVNGNINKFRTALEKTPDINKYLTIQNQLAVLPSLHADKTIYSRLMDVLPALNPSAPHSVSLSSVSVIEDGTAVSFSGQTPTFEALGVFKDTLAYAVLQYQTTDGGGPVSENLFTDVVIESSGLAAQTEGRRVVFSIRALYNMNAFSTNIASIGVTVPSLQSSQSADYPARSIFREGGQR